MAIRRSGQAHLKGAAARAVGCLVRVVDRAAAGRPSRPAGAMRGADAERVASTGAASDSNALAKAVGLDMADWWEPTAQGYLNHVPKAQIVQALKEAGPDLADDGVGAMKKDVLVVKAASRLAGKRWLPAMLLPRSAPER